VHSKAPVRPAQNKNANRRCRFSCRLIPTLSGIAKGEKRQIPLSVNVLQTSCRSSYSPSLA
jgi:hypothetical protein